MQANNLPTVSPRYTDDTLAIQWDSGLDRDHPIVSLYRQCIEAIQWASADQITTYLPTVSLYHCLDEFLAAVSPSCKEFLMNKNQTEIMDNCSNCRFWRLFDPEEDERGQCRRHAPAAQLMDAAGCNSNRDFAARVWPVTYADDWCGDYQPLSKD